MSVIFYYGFFKWTIVFRIVQYLRAFVWCDKFPKNYKPFKIYHHLYIYTIKIQLFEIVRAKICARFL